MPFLVSNPDLIELSSGPKGASSQAKRGLREVKYVRVDHRDMRMRIGCFTIFLCPVHQLNMVVSIQRPFSHDRFPRLG